MRPQNIKKKPLRVRVNVLQIRYFQNIDTSFEKYVWRSSFLVHLLFIIENLKIFEKTLFLVFFKEFYQDCWLISYLSQKFLEFFLTEYISIAA